jgi:hypothetical protein
VAVLALPGEPAEYLRGRQRQALRTNLTKAAAAGVTCAAVADAAEVRRAVAHVAAARQQDPATMVPDRAERRVRSRFTVAFDRTGTPVALAETVLDGAWAGLATLVTAHTGVAGFDADSEARQVVRYQLHSAVVGELIGQGVERLTVAGSMLLTPTGTRYFQRRTGYEPVRLRIPSVGRDRSSVPAE